MFFNKKNFEVAKNVDSNSNTISEKIDDNNAEHRRGKGLSFVSATVFIIGEVAGAGLLTLPKATQGIGIIKMSSIKRC